MVRKVSEHGFFRRKEVDLFGVSGTVLYELGPTLDSDYVRISFYDCYEGEEGAACEADWFKSGWYIPLR